MALLGLRAAATLPSISSDHWQAVATICQPPFSSFASYVMTHSLPARTHTAAACCPSNCRVRIVPHARGSEQRQQQPQQQHEQQQQQQEQQQQKQKHGRKSLTLRAEPMWKALHGLWLACAGLRTPADRLSSLPQELFDRIARNLSTRDLRALQQCSRSLRHTVSLCEWHHATVSISDLQLFAPSCVPRLHVSADSLLLCCAIVTAAFAEAFARESAEAQQRGGVAAAVWPTAWFRLLLPSPVIPWVSSLLAHASSCASVAALHTHMPPHVRIGTLSAHAAHITSLTLLSSRRDLMDEERRHLHEALGMFHSLQSLECNALDLTPCALHHMHQLLSLYIKGKGAGGFISAASLLPKLSSLTVDNRRNGFLMEEAAAQQLGPHLQTFVLRALSSPFSLRHLTALTQLDLEQDAEFDMRVVSAMPCLGTLHLSVSRLLVTDEASCPQLTTLRLELSSGGAVPLRFPSLRSLHLSLGWGGWQHYRARGCLSHMAMLEELHFAGADRFVSLLGLEDTWALRRLRRVEVPTTVVSDECVVSALVHITSLRLVGLLEDGQMLGLMRLSALCELDVFAHDALGAANCLAGLPCLTALSVMGMGAVPGASSAVPGRHAASEATRDPADALLFHQPEDDQARIGSDRISVCGPPTRLRSLRLTLHHGGGPRVMLKEEVPSLTELELVGFHSVRFDPLCRPSLSLLGRLADLTVPFPPFASLASKLCLRLPFAKRASDHRPPTSGESQPLFSPTSNQSLAPLLPLLANTPAVPNPVDALRPSLPGPSGTPDPESLLPNLTSLKLTGLGTKQLHAISPVALPRLQVLTVGGTALRCIHGSWLALPSLLKAKIVDCPSLWAIYGLRHAVSAAREAVSKEDKRHGFRELLERSEGGHTHAPPYRTALSAMTPAASENAPMSVRPRQRFHSRTSCAPAVMGLRELSISGCPQLLYLPQSLKLLKALHTVRLSFSGVEDPVAQNFFSWHGLLEWTLLIALGFAGITMFVIVDRWL